MVLDEEIDPKMGLIDLSVCYEDPEDKREEIKIIMKLYFHTGYPS
jgi:hypothetical protein